MSKKADNSRFANGDDLQLVGLGSKVLFSSFNLTTSSGKHIEDIYHAHIISLRYKLITSTQDTDDLTIGFDRDRIRRQQELANNKTVQGKDHLRIMLKYCFGYKEFRKKATYGPGSNLTLTRKKDDAILDKVAGIADATIKIDQTQLYVPHYTTHIPQQGIML